MSAVQHLPIVLAAIGEAAKAAYAVDVEAVQALIPPSENMSPTEAVAALMAMKPHLFGPKPAKDMTPDEYKLAKRKLLRDAELRRVGLTSKT